MPSHAQGTSGCSRLRAESCSRRRAVRAYGSSRRSLRRLAAWARRCAGRASRLPALKPTPTPTPTPAPTPAPAACRPAWLDRDFAVHPSLNRPLTHTEHFDRLATIMVSNPSERAVHDTPPARRCTWAGALVVRRAAACPRAGWHEQAFATRSASGHVKWRCDEKGDGAFAS